MHLQGTQCLRSPASHRNLGEKHGADSPSQPSEGAKPADTWILGSQHPELHDNTFVAVRYGGPKKVMQALCYVSLPLLLSPVYRGRNCASEWPCTSRGYIIRVTKPSWVICLLDFKAVTLPDHKAASHNKGKGGTRWENKGRGRKEDGWELSGNVSI